jgi:simple sugar transport system ATP-binding protein
VLAGRHAVASGTLDGPRAVGFVPEDRHRDAVLLDRPLTENVALRGAGRRRGMLSWSRVRRHTASLLNAFDVRAGDVHAPMRTLSGGNQQKVVLAREMDESAGDPAEHGEPLRAIVAENPTRGLDVRASAEVHARLRAARDRGATVLVYSSDLEEVLALATRVLVVYDGRVREVRPDRDAVGRAMLGLA